MSNSNGFTSNADMIAAMKAPRYTTDEAYRAEVYEKTIAMHGRTQSPGSGAAAPGGVQAFRSKAEMYEAMKDPRYAKDEAYREDVARRLKDSGLI